MSLDVQCTFCINIDLIFIGETMEKRNETARPIQNAVRKYGCPDFFRAWTR